MPFLFFIVCLVAAVFGNLFDPGLGLYVEIALIGAVLLWYLRELMKRLPPKEEDSQPEDTASPEDENLHC